MIPVEGTGPSVAGDGDGDAWRANYATTVALAVRLDALRRFLRTSGPFGLQTLSAADVADRRVLEVGCGGGGHAARLLGRPGVRCAEWVLLDRSEEMVRTALARVRAAVGRRRASSVRGVVGDVDHLPIARGARFDWVVAMHVHQHLASPLRATRALAARLAPGGRLLLTTMDARDNDELRRIVRRRLRASGVATDGVASPRAAAAAMLRGLRRVFRSVVVHVQHGVLEFPTADDALRYVGSMAWLDGVPDDVRDAVRSDLRAAALREIARTGTFRVTKSAATFIASAPRPQRRRSRASAARRVRAR